VVGASTSGVSKPKSGSLLLPPPPRRSGVPIAQPLAAKAPPSVFQSDEWSSFGSDPFTASGGSAAASAVPGASSSFDAFGTSDPFASVNPRVTPAAKSTAAASGAGNNVNLLDL